MNAWTIIGTIASLAGVFVGFWTLKTAQGAKEAAEQAARRARERDLLEELEKALSKIDQIGIFLLSSEWTVAHLRAMEVQSTCSGAVVRWADSLSETSRNSLLTAGQLVNSIAAVAYELRIFPTETKKRRIASDRQLRASRLISEVLAEARMKVERGKE